MSIHANKLMETQRTLTRKEEAEETNGTKEDEASYIACLDKSSCLDEKNSKKVLEDNSEDTVEDLKNSLSEHASCHATRTDPAPVFEQSDKTQTCSSTPTPTFIAVSPPKDALTIGDMDLEIQDQPPGLGN